MPCARSIRRALLLNVVVGLLSIESAASASGRMVQIYDTEIENIIRVYAKPVFRAAGIAPGTVRIHLVLSNVPNAFVSGGRHMFLTTGLLRAAEHPGQVIGVLAHETGHIAGGHLARLDSMMRDAAAPAMLTTALAVTLGVLAGSADAAIAAVGAGATAVNRRLLSFTRAQEQAADRAAVSYLEKSGQSARGLYEFLGHLDDQQALILSRSDQERLGYNVTHPLTRDRIAYLRDHVERSKYSDRAISPALRRMHARMIAKLDGFVDPPARTLAKYKASDRRLPARYARAIALYRKTDTENALRATAELIAEHPEDPYFHELMGQILFESGRIAEAVPRYERAVELAPDAPLLRVGLAHAQIELGREDLIGPALRHLKVAMREEDTGVLVWRLAATAYGRSGRPGLSALASAEYALRTGQRGDAVHMAERAKRLLKEGTPGRLRAEDLIASLKRQKRR